MNLPSNASRASLDKVEGYGNRNGGLDEINLAGMRVILPPCNSTSSQEDPGSPVVGKDVPTEEGRQVEHLVMEFFIIVVKRR